MNRDDLEALREGSAFEARPGLGCDGLGAVPGSLWETYNAFANRKFGAQTMLRGKWAMLRGKLRGKLPKLRQKVVPFHARALERLGA